MADAETVDAWRIFGLTPEGVLFAPYGPIAWPDATELHLWEMSTLGAGCVVAEHPVPDPDCTCGIRGVTDLDELLTVATRRVPGGGTLGDAGVIAKVKLSGRMLPGIAMPRDDPRTTLRVERAEILELHLSPRHVALGPQVAARYGVPTYNYDEEEWAGFVPPQVDAQPDRQVEPAGPDAFVAEVCREGFGNKDLSDPTAPAVILKMGRSVCDALRNGVSVHDIASVMFDTSAAPTGPQIGNLMRSAVENLDPSCAFAYREEGYVHARPLELGEMIGRTFQNIARDVFAAASQRMAQEK